MEIGLQCRFAHPRFHHFAIGIFEHHAGEAHEPGRGAGGKTEMGERWWGELECVGLPLFAFVIGIEGDTLSRRCLRR